MWQTLEMTEIAKILPLVSEMGNGQNSTLIKHLRDFSIRKLPDEKLEILAPQQQEPHNACSCEEKGELEDSDGDEEEDEEELKEKMVPFSLDTSSTTKFEPQEVIDIEAIKNQAFQHGQELAQETYEAEKQQLIELHQQELEQVRQQTIEEMALDLKKSCEDAFIALKISLGGDLAELISPFIGEKLSDEAAAEFVTQLANTAISSKEPLTIEGNQFLLDAFIAHAANEPKINLDRYHLVAGDHNELRLTYENKILSTRLTPLLQQLREII